MRVLHIITRMIIGGAQENTLLNCLDLRRLFDDDVVLATGPTRGPEGRLLEQGRAGELAIETIPALRRAIVPWNDVTCYRQLRQAIRRFSPDVVHTHSAKAGFLGRLAAAREGVPAIVHTVHGAPFHPYQGAAARQLFIGCERYAGRRCHRLISVADAMTDLMVDAHVAPKEKFVTIYSGMDIQPFLDASQFREKARRQYGFDDQTIVIGKIARLFHLKGHDDLLTAAARVAAALPQVKFLLVGDGVLRPQLEAQAAELGLGDQVVFAGLVPPEQIPFMLSAMDLLTHTSLREGLPRTLPQALLAGIPVVSFDVDGAREVCRSGETGFLVPARDTTQLADRLIELGQSAELRQRFAHTGRELCVQRFPHETMTRRIREVYEEVLGRAAPPA